MRRRAKTFWMGGLWLLAASAVGAAERPQPMVGEPAPDFSLESLDGARVRLGDFRGRYVVLHFGAGW